MNIVLAIVIFVLLVSLIFLAVNLTRTFSLSSDFRLTESCYTMLFRVCRLRHFLVAYILLVVAHAVGSIFFIFYLS
ncbi:hypothetical protein KJ951_04140 [Patescibacteria group bacterium]|nr:hypothetical protein [Patescibacteria group bacterium]MBU1703569.1 hypothetical protein [Patescibacteria group bacterium]MBU1954080.1 hypothetical protein [Patescibacteria group bacterium]